MSRLSRERIKISISPLQVAFVRASLGWKKTAVMELRHSTCAPTQEGRSWNGALETLRTLLEQRDVLAAPVTVILSNHFVRYMVLPWSAELVTQSEELDFARARFAQVFGDMAHQWAIRTSDAPAGVSRVAAATDKALLEALAHVFKASNLALVSCQPALMAQLNASRRKIGDNAWLVCAEHGRVLTACIDQGRWRSVRTRPLNGSAIALRDLLEQERILVSASERDHQIFISAADDVVFDTQGMVAQPLALRSANQPEIPADGPYSLAMAGLQ